MAARKGTENLIPTNMRSKDEVRENSRKGGIKSGEVRQEKARLKKTMLALLETSIKVSETEMSAWDAITLGQIKKAVSGDTAAYNAIRDIIGEKPAEKVDTTISGAMQFNSGGLRETLEELKKKD